MQAYMRDVNHRQLFKTSVKQRHLDKKSGNLDVERPCMVAPG